MIAMNKLRRDAPVPNGSRPAARPRTCFVTVTALVLLLMAALQGLQLNWGVEAAGLGARPKQGTAQGEQEAGPVSVRPTRAVATTTASAPVMFDEVKERLLAVASSRQRVHADKYIWPPNFRLEDSADPNAYPNAYASIWYENKTGPVTCPIDKKTVCADHTLKIDRDEEGNISVLPIDKRTNKLFPQVVFDEGLMREVIENDPDRLAFIVGHELSHIMLGHVLPSSAAYKAPTSTLSRVFTAEQEHDADVLGMKLALAANYSIKGAREAWARMNSEEFRKKYPGWNYTSFEGVSKTHPSWTDRLGLIDKEKTSLWKAMSAFENGVFFLTSQKYAEAEEAFKRVVDPARGFPDSYDAWANLGYALLMQYFDKLDAGDVARFDVGQLVVGSFYHRPETLTPQVRGVDAELWSRAVAALRKALELNPNATLAKANLGVAYLLAPTGKNAREAMRHLEAAAAAAGGDRSLTDANRAAVYINAAVALSAGGENEKASLRLDQVAALNDAETFQARIYNRALLLSQVPDARNRKSAVFLLNNYLVGESMASLWWEPAYRLYARLAPEVGQTPKTLAELRAASMAEYSLRPVTSVEIGRGVLITLSDPVNAVREKLGPAQAVPVVSGTNLVRLFYPARGLEILAGRRVVAMFLRGESAPTLKVQSRVPGGPATSLRVGMNESEVRGLLGTRYAVVPLTDPEVAYNFYPGVGVAVRYGRDNRVEELVVAQATIKRG